MGRFSGSMDIKVVSAQLRCQPLVVRYLHQCKPEHLFFTSLYAAVFKDTMPTPREMIKIPSLHQSNSNQIAPSHQSRAGDGFIKAKLTGRRCADRVSFGLEIFASWPVMSRPGIVEVVLLALCTPIFRAYGCLVVVRWLRQTVVCRQSSAPLLTAGIPLILCPTG